MRLNITIAKKVAAAYVADYRKLDMDDLKGCLIKTAKQYTSYENKNRKDMDIYDDVLTCGRGFRYVGSTKITEEDEAPFEIINVNVLNTEVVYSSGIP